MEVENEIKFANISKILIQYLNKTLHELEDDELVFVLIDDGDEIQTGIALIDDLVLLVIKEIAHFGVTGDY